MADKKIEPCPRCGGECVSLDCMKGWYIFCIEDELKCSYEWGYERREAEAIAAHNKVSRANAIADSYAGLFEAVESDIDRMKERSHAYDAFDDVFDDPFVQAVYKAYNAVLDAEEGT